MDFAHDDESTALQQTLRELFGERCTSAAVRAAEESDLGWDRELWRVVGAAGMIGIGLAEDLGGQGGDAVHEAIVANEAGRVVAPVPLVETARALRLLEAAGPACEAWLRAVVAGERVVVPLDTELTGGESSLDGRTPVVPYGLGADAFLARTVDGVAFLIRTDDAGVSVRRQPALGPAPIAEVTLRGASGQPLGDIPWDAADAASRLSASAWAAGGIGGVLDYALVYARDRRQFGRPIGAFQAVQHRFADMALDHERARLLALLAATEANGADAGRALDAAIVVCLDGYRRVSASACQILGGYGFMLEYDAQLHFRAAKALRLLFPASPAVQRLGATAAAVSRKMESTHVPIRQ